MAARITPLKPGESDDSEVNDILAQMQEEWWNDSAMLGVLGANTVARPAAAEGFRVASLPTPVLFDDGMEVFRFAGAALVSTLDAKLDERSQAAPA
jgi:thioredoxin-like negative regulator of GroEL